MVYNEIYIKHPDFIPADPDGIVSWSAKEQIPLCKDINELFGHPLFFEFARPLDMWTIPTLEKLSVNHELIVCSVGVPENISKKAKHIQKWFPMVHQSILLMQSDCKMDKSIVDMSSKTCPTPTIFIDDVVSNLLSSNADVKICIGKKYEWNKNWTGYRCLTWEDVAKFIL